MCEHYFHTYTDNLKLVSVHNIPEFFYVVCFNSLSGKHQFTGNKTDRFAHLFFQMVISATTSSEELLSKCVKIHFKIHEEVLENCYQCHRAGANVQ